MHAVPHRAVTQGSSKAHTHHYYTITKQLYIASTPVFFYILRLLKS